MGIMANTLGISPLPILPRSSKLTLFRPLSSSTPFKRVAVPPLKCSSSPNTNPDTETSSLRSISPYTWCAALGSLGFLETGYLTYIKLTNSDAFCPVGGGTCSDVLNSAYAVISGVPLPLIGMVAYGLVASLGLQLAGKNLPFGLSETNGRLVLLGSTATMATASAYFMYLLSTKLAGASCSYCLISAFLSFCLFFITLKVFGLQEIQKEVGLLVFISSIVVVTLSSSYSTAQPEVTKLASIDLEPFETEVTTKSSPLAISLAKHLRSIGAKIYGAFWCSHCLEQKQMFGDEGAKILDYVECFPDGIGKGKKMANACEVVGIEGFPTWVIKDKVLSGEKTFSELAEASGFVLEDFHPA
ncbi:thiol-disulfide oxidoreductase LTO1 [Magnolia sinica]|uniref:thiol-disulfide oxidoreductase LTO1 n=1 Tax=Magnolia sinica TaxID=86752 RepID=UPI00265A5B66|nr:thiol-disulfide oxidoreductase LTO1 [Magnolia sinica]